MEHSFFGKFHSPKGTRGSAENAETSNIGRNLFVLCGEILGTLYIVGTPIGNLEDLSLRAARILGEVGLVAAEDTRVARRLLNHLGLRTRVTSFHEHNSQQKLPRIMAILEEQDVALISDAGMPGVSDPGRELVVEAASAGWKVETVPGPSAVTTGLSASGFSGDAFVFLGFLPRRRKERQEALQPYASHGQTLVIFEAPHRLRAALEDLHRAFADRPLAVCRELTKLHEEIFRGTALEALEHFANPRGEFVMVVSADAAATDAGPSDSSASVEAIRVNLLELRDAGVRAKDAVSRTAAAYGVPKNLVYRLWLEEVRARPQP